jgi:23S rRNA (pseudouridine1915-N3)-methyltransferase
MLATLRDHGAGMAIFLIGGADGHDKMVRKQADRILSFGPMVWPHMMVRAMLAEQLYRAMSILSGGPYHRA